MAKYTVTHTCGHNNEHQLFGKETDRQRRLEWLATTDCCDCYKAAQQAQAANAAQEAGLPELDGSDKQIAWAETIRAKLLAQLDAALAPSPAMTDAQREQGERALAAIRSNADARYWIDNREQSAKSLFIAAIRAL